MNWSSISLCVAGNEGLRLKKPEGCAAGTWEHIAKCFHVDPAERPSFTDLVQHMQAVESKAVSRTACITSCSRLQGNSVPHKRCIHAKVV